jgi:hypothetical protein
MREFAHHDFVIWRRDGVFVRRRSAFGTERIMQRNRAIAIAAQKQAESKRLILLASLLLLPAALLLLLISP